MSGRRLIFIALMLVLMSCEDGGGYNSAGPAFAGIVQFSMVGDSTGDQDFMAVTNEFELVQLATAEMQLPFSERTLFPVGPIDRGDGGHNFHQSDQPRFQWNWHFLPEEWNLTDVAAPLCDGNALIVEQAVNYWVDSVGQFCPSGARVAHVSIIQH